MLNDIFWIQILFRLWFGVGLCWQSKCPRTQKVTWWVAQRLHITAIWVKTGRVVKSVDVWTGLIYRLFIGVGNTGQPLQLSWSETIGEPDHSLGFISPVVCCASGAQINALLTPDQMHILYEGVHTGAMFKGNVRYTGGRGSHLNRKGTFRLLEPNMYF